MTERKTECGHVKWFDEQKGFGFIVRSIGSDIFFHKSQVKHISISTGDAVEYFIAQEKAGKNKKRLKAMCVKKIKNEEMKIPDNHNDVITKCNIPFDSSRNLIADGIKEIIFKLLSKLTLDMDPQRMLFFGLSETQHKSYQDVINSGYAELTCFRQKLINEGLPATYIDSVIQNEMSDNNEDGDEDEDDWYTYTYGYSKQDVETSVDFFRPDGNIERKSVMWCKSNGFFQVKKGMWSGKWYKEMKQS
eukprot:UN01086